MAEPKRQGNKRFIIWMVVALVIVAADQLTKWAIVEWVALYDKVPLNSFVNLTHQRNPGAAFSFLADAGGWHRWFFVTLAAGVSCVIAVWLWRIRHQGQAVLGAGLALVLGGAVGNLIDRINHGYVVDFIDVYYRDWHWPAFNLADSAITCGVVLMLIDGLFLSSSAKQPTED